MSKRNVSPSISIPSVPGNPVAEPLKALMFAGGAK